MHIHQQKLFDLSKTKDLSSMTLKQIAALIGEEHPQKAKHHLQQLNKKGLLLFPFREKSATETDLDIQILPIFGAVNCGPASLLAEENIEGHLRVSKRLLPEGKKNLFVLRAVGNSMNNAKIGLPSKIKKPIYNGDYVVVESKQYSPVEDDYILSIIDGAANIKRFKKINDEEIALISDSTEDFAPIFIHSDDQYSVCGQVVQVLKNEK